MLAIGVHYRQEYGCPVEPRISHFLVVGGSVSLVWILITIILSLMTMFFAYTRSMGTMILVVITFLGQIFSLIYFVIAHYMN